MNATATTSAKADGPGRWIVQGRTVTMPVEVRDASSGAVTYLVSAAVARRLLPDDRLEIVEVLPGTALFSLAVIDYRDNDLGSSTPERFDLFRGDSCNRLNNVVLEAARPFGV